MSVETIIQSRRTNKFVDRIIMIAASAHAPALGALRLVPSDVQPPTLFVGALPKNSQHPDAAIALLHFLSSADAAAVITKAGLNPFAAR